MNSEITIKRTQSSNEDFNNLILQLDNDLCARYQSAQAAYDKHNKIEAINTVIIAYDNGRPIGCGCFKNYNSETIEIKRMFVTDCYRGMGISKLILKELENWAKELGFSKAILETGTKQSEAIGLYKRSGYNRITNYGQYIDLLTSVCFYKNL